MEKSGERPVLVTTEFRGVRRGREGMGELNVNRFVYVIVLTLAACGGAPPPAPVDATVGVQRQGIPGACDVIEADFLRAMGRNPDLVSNSDAGPGIYVWDFYAERVRVQLWGGCVVYVRGICGGWEP